MDPEHGATTNTAHPLIGQVVGGRYHIIELIGEGGMGVVYKAEQRLGSTVRKVAVKTLHAELSRDAAITARFHREVGTIAHLEHPNTVRVYDFGSTDDGTLYIAMEYLDGRPLNKVIETDGALEPRRVAHLICQVAGSLDEAHRQGIVHRDLKPENVLLMDRAGEKDVVKLVDFGIAARTETADREKEQKLTQQGMVLGTPPYMSPEQFTGKHLDARSDVYSLGIMAYEMLTGQLPFQADTPWQWATHHMTSQPRSFDDLPSGTRIPEGLRRTVLKALSKEPQDRQSGAGQFYAEFNAALQSASAPARAPSGGKTEAMPQGAPFAMAATEHMPAASPIAARSPATASPPVALPPAPRPERPSGNKGLIYGLSGVGAVLLIAMGVVALNGRSSDSAPPLDLTPSASTPRSPTAEEPTTEAAEPSAAETTDPVLTPEATEPPPRAAKPAASKPAPSKPNPSPSTPASAPASTPAPTVASPAVVTPPASVPATPAPTAPQPATPVTPAPQPQPAAPVASAADPCASCINAAKDNNFAGAAGFYAQCNSAAAKKQCTNRVAQSAPRQAETAALNQRCAEARVTIRAALAMGVPEGRLAKAIAACK
jgi:eukaryotic-like serine/threonine-protein kinase